MKREGGEAGGEEKGEGRSEEWQTYLKSKNPATWRVGKQKQMASKGANKQKNEKASKGTD